VRIAIGIIISATAVFAWSFGDAVINELMWMGTSLSPYDEFLEIRNMTDETVDFSETPWSLYREDELMLVIGDGVLPPNGLFLICRREPSSSIISATPDVVSGGLVLTNSNTSYALYAGPNDSSPILDIADDGEGYPMSGRYIPEHRVYWSMERNDPPGDGSEPDNWHVACLTIGFAPGAIERGTPGSENYKNIPPDSPESLRIEPAYIADDTVVAATAFGVSDSDTIPGDPIVIFDWLLDDTVIVTTIDSILPFTAELPSSYTLPGRFYAARTYVFDGTDSSDAFYSDSFFVHFENGDVVFSELAWAGSMRSRFDEWVELRNYSDKTVDFSQTPFMVKALTATSPEPVDMLNIDSGIIAPNEFFIISNFAETESTCALNTIPDIIDEEVSLLNGRLLLRLFDNPSEIGGIIDIAGDGLAPFAGFDSPDDSARYSMSRIDPPGDGSNSTNWFTSEISRGFKPGSLERGSPGSENTRNNPPHLEWVGDEGYVSDGLEPETGTKDTFFVWRVEYFDADNDPPDYVNLLFDKNYDGVWDSTEGFSMARENPTDTDYTDGAVYRKWLHGLAPTSSGSPYSFRASDGLTVCALGIPPLPGPVVEPTIKLLIFGTSWRPDTVFGEPSIVTNLLQMPILIHNGDVPIQVGLSITEADIYPHSSDTFSFSPGGWTFAERLDTSGINLYKLSALIIPAHGEAFPGDFNDLSEDLLTSEIKWFDGDTLGRPADGLSANFPPGDRRRLAFRLDLPEAVYGFYSRWEHRITVRIYMRMPLP